MLFSVGVVFLSIFIIGLLVLGYRSLTKHSVKLSRWVAILYLAMTVFAWSLGDQSIWARANFVAFGLVLAGSFWKVGNKEGGGT